LIAIKATGRRLRRSLEIVAQRHRDSACAMKVKVETYVDEGGAEKLRRIRFDGRVVEVADNIDQWHGADYRYAKVSDGGGNIYILRHDDGRAEWGLTMYQRRP
jgi:hypothetical protein